mgnify:CR=1 FL=1
MKKIERIMQYVKEQVNVDLSEVRTDFAMKFERKNEIIIEYRELSKTEWRKVEVLAATKKVIRIEDVGVWGKMIALTA